MKNGIKEERRLINWPKIRACMIIEIKSVFNILTERLWRWTCNPEVPLAGVVLDSPEFNFSCSCACK